MFKVFSAGGSSTVEEIGAKTMGNSTDQNFSTRTYCGTAKPTMAALLKAQIEEARYVLQFYW